MNKIISRLLAVIFLLLQLAASALCIITLNELNMLPSKLFIAMCVVFAAAALFSAVLLLPALRGRIGVRGVFGIIFSLIVSVGSCAAVFAMSQVQDTVSAITAAPKLSIDYGIYVRADDAAQSVAELENAVWGSFSPAAFSDSLAEAESTLSESADFAISPDSFDDVYALTDALISGSVDAAIFACSYEDIIADTEGYETFDSSVRLLYTVSMFLEKEEHEDAPAENPNAFIVYLSGSDTRSYHLATSRSDVNILAVINTDTREILLVNTPRDYYVPISVSDYEMCDKLTHCGLYGPQCSMDTLGTLYGQKIRYYARINFFGLERLVDAVGGVRVYSDSGFRIGDSFVNQGWNDLNGTQALAFSRERKLVAGGDNTRGKNQMKVISAVIDKLSAGTLLRNYTDILDSLEGMFVTNVSYDKISELVKAQLENPSSWDIHSFAVTGESGSERTFTVQTLRAYVMYPNDEDVTFASSLIQRVLSGEKLKDSDLKRP